MDSPSNKKPRYQLKESDGKPDSFGHLTLLGKLTSDASLLEATRMEQEGKRVRAALFFIAFMIAVTFFGAFVPGVGFKDAAAFTLPVITFVAGMLTNRVSPPPA